MPQKVHLRLILHLHYITWTFKGSLDKILRSWLHFQRITAGTSPRQTSKSWCCSKPFTQGDILVSEVCVHTHTHTLRALACSPLPYPYFSQNIDAHAQTITAHTPTCPTPHALAVAVAPSPSLFLSSGCMKGESTLWETLLCGRCRAGTTSPCGLTSKCGGGVMMLTIHVCADWECLWSIYAAFLPKPVFTSYSCGENLPYGSQTYT